MSSDRIPGVARLAWVWLFCPSRLPENDEPWSQREALARDRLRCWWPRDEQEGALRDDALWLVRLLEETRELATAHPLCWFMIEAIRRRSRRRARSRGLEHVVPQPPAREHDLANASREQWVASMAGVAFARGAWATIGGVFVLLVLALAYRLLMPELGRLVMRP